MALTLPDGSIIDDMPSSGYRLRLCEDIRREAQILRDTGACPHCVNDTGRLRPDWPLRLQQILAGLTLHCLVCGREITYEAL